MTEPVLTAEGREQLTQRLHRLQSQVLPELLEAFKDRHRDGEVVIDYERALVEVHKLEALLAEARAVEDSPDDPAVVELGDLVTVEQSDGEIERYLIVDPLEASLDDVRISAASPLAQALLGHRVGEMVTVTGPAGSYTCQVLGAARPMTAG